MLTDGRMVKSIELNVNHIPCLCMGCASGNYHDDVYKMDNIYLGIDHLQPVSVST
jgi:hypothetical protein